MLKTIAMGSLLCLLGTRGLSIATLKEANTEILKIQETHKSKRRKNTSTIKTDCRSYVVEKKYNEADE
jgi:hypothetical protein